jgi:hypothetical protein
MARQSLVVWIVFAVMVLPAVPLTLAAGVSAAPTSLHNVREGPLVLPGSGSFAFVSNFEDFSTDGWQAVQGTAKVVNNPTYNGEPALKSSATTKAAQVDLTVNSPTQQIVPGGSFVSFQVVLKAGSVGTGFFGLADSSGAPLATIGIGGGYVWAASGSGVAQKVEPIPSGTAQPSGWVYVTANVYNASSANDPSAGWTMQVFVDRTDVVAATIAVPSAGSYATGIMMTTHGTVYYSNAIITSADIPTYLPGYNNMDGYGQGSGLEVALLPAFTLLTADMTLTSWNTPQLGILSFQINAMNYYGTTRNSCVGFFQLGVDLDPNGTIAPWYVPGVNCFAHYFLTSSNPAVQSGVATPPGSHLTLTISDVPAMNAIVFQIVDHTIRRTWSATVPYSGTEFYGSYTQIEWQPCCSNFPISDYYLDGTLYHMAISGGSVTGSVPLSQPYMIPFILDAPPSWNFNYYVNPPYAGYEQIG